MIHSWVVQFTMQKQKFENTPAILISHLFSSLLPPPKHSVTILKDWWVSNSLNSHRVSSCFSAQVPPPGLVLYCPLAHLAVRLIFYGRPAFLPSPPQLWSFSRFLPAFLALKVADFRVQQIVQRPEYAQMETGRGAVLVRWSLMYDMVSVR